MQFVSYRKTDTYYEFVTDKGEKVLMPSTDVILVDDESGLVSVKNTASRCTIGTILQ